MEAAGGSPQIYLIAPPDPGSDVAQRVGRLLDAVPVACLRLRTASRSEADIARGADALREAAHARDVPLVIEEHVGLVPRLGLDGVQLTDGARSVREARRVLGKDAIVGAYCGASRHDGLNSGEAGADYVAFGPAGASQLGSGGMAERDLFAWWSEMIELPVVAEGALTPEIAADLAPVADFIALGDEIWSAGDPEGALRRYAGILSGAYGA